VKFHILVSKKWKINNVGVLGTNLLKICYENHNRVLGYDLEIEFPDNLWIWHLSMGASPSRRLQTGVPYAWPRGI
jgi:hypothetical protein